jgi:hypothetical protein
MYARKLELRECQTVNTYQTWQQCQRFPKQLKISWQAGKQQTLTGEGDMSCSTCSYSQIYSIAILQDPDPILLEPLPLILAVEMGEVVGIGKLWKLEADVG